MMKSTVTSIGEMAFAFEEDKVIVLFGQKAPTELREISIIHETESIDEQSLQNSRQLVINGTKYEIVSIGAVGSEKFGGARASVGIFHGAARGYPTWSGVREALSATSNQCRIRD